MTPRKLMCLILIALILTSVPVGAAEDRLTSGTWLVEFDNLTQILRNKIIAVNSTRVHLASAAEMMSWLRNSINFLKEWEGLGALAGLLVLVSLMCLWCIVRLRVSQQRNAAMITQAFTAVEARQSPQAWLAALKA